MKTLALFVLVMLVATNLVQAEPAKPVTFDTHDGYFVSNKFEPDAPASFVVLQDQKAFDKVFGSGFVMNDKHHRLPKDAFESKMVVAAIKRGKAVWTYKVDAVTADAGILTVGYTAKTEANPTTEFACPLIVSVPKGDNLAVQFVEDGKVVKKIDLVDSPPADKGDAPAAFDIKCRKKDDAIAVSTEGDKTTFTVTSGSGIGGATVERKVNRWPDELILRVHLRGLESLTLSSGDVKLAASVLSHGDNQRLLHLWKDGKEGSQLEKDSPYWMDIQPLDAGGKANKGLPEKGGWFEMKIPKAMLTGQPKTITLEWIDFYRG